MEWWKKGKAKVKGNAQSATNLVGAHSRVIGPVERG